jgi:hypothetical protein
MHAVEILNSGDERSWAIGLSPCEETDLTYGNYRLQDLKLLTAATAKGDEGVL